MNHRSQKMYLFVGRREYVAANESTMGSNTTASRLSASFINSLIEETCQVVCSKKKKNHMPVLFRLTLEHSSCFI